MRCGVYSVIAEADIFILLLVCSFLDIDGAGQHTALPSRYRVKMGSSARRKKEKKQDFQKAKLKVGKAKAKADNYTDTSFKAKCMSLFYT